ncbi:MAG TPA: class I SAM-dependent methyltransferase [Acidobacteriaceae bacterium]|jgi:SAM-dependent methyltransferase
MTLLKGAVKGGFAKLGFDIRRSTPPPQVVKHSPEKIKLFEFVHTTLQAIEDSLNETSTRADVFSQLRSVGLGNFGLSLLSLPNPDFPKISALLPRMASEEIQINWTGCAGTELYKQTLGFVRSISENYAAITRRSLKDAQILDYGCGYGRITRLMYYFTSEENIYGVDPWDRSVGICHADGLTKNILLSDRLPSTLPVPDSPFDLIFAFSVFTHLSENGTLTCLNTIAKYIKPDGLVVITIRPVEYWDIDRYANELSLVEQQKSIHRRDGFSFLPHHDSAVVDGEKTYGDTSLTLDWLQRSLTSLKIVGMDASPSDPYQIYVFLQKA